MAAMCALFSQARVCPAVSRTEGDPKARGPGDDAYRELRNTIEDSTFRGSTLVITRPEDVRLAWEMRE